MSNKNNKPQQNNNGGAASVRAQFWQGPIPPPQVLAQYDKIAPGLAKEIIEQWKNESQHRRETELKTISVANYQARADFIQKIFALILAAALICTALGVGVYLVIVDRAIEGWIALTSSLVLIFVGRQINKNSE